MSDKDTRVSCLGMGGQRNSSSTEIKDCCEHTPGEWAPIRTSCWALLLKDKSHIDVKSMSTFCMCRQLQINVVTHLASLHHCPWKHKNKLGLYVPHPSLKSRCRYAKAELAWLGCSWLLWLEGWSWKDKHTPTTPSEMSHPNSILHLAYLANVS